MLSKMKIFTQRHTAVEQGSWDLDRDVSDSRTYPVIFQVWPQLPDSESPRVLSLGCHRLICPRVCILTLFLYLDIIVL